MSAGFCSSLESGEGERKEEEQTVDTSEHLCTGVHSAWTISSQVLLSSSFSDKEIQLREVK